MGSVLVVDGADMMDGTPIYDIKPYLPFTDSHPDARAGFADGVVDLALEVDFPPALLAKLPEHLRSGAVAMLAQNPTPHYQKDPARVYGIAFGGYDIRFPRFLMAWPSSLMWSRNESAVCRREFAKTLLTCSRIQLY